ncbi:MAG: NAD(P)-dependent oxidoreductase [Prevotella sp.]|nr:NAD(P)-dependent oxidoreductase [Prevotella sp.]
MCEIKKQKKVVVFGATGNLGVHIALHLQKQGYEVIAVGHRLNDNGFFSLYNIQYFSIDIVDASGFKILPQKDVFGVVHFAGVLPAVMKGFNATPYIQSIIQGTLNVLEYTRNIGADRIIFPQTLFDIKYLFGTKVPISPDSVRKVTEDDHWMYVIAKNASVEMIEHYYKAYGLKRFILRLSRIYLYHPNPYTYLDGKKVLISDRYLIYRAMMGKDLEIWGDPHRLLETICIKDFLQIIEKAMNADVDGGIYNVGSGGSTLKERIEGIMEIFSPQDKNAKIIYCPNKSSSQQFVLDIRKTVEELGYIPQYSWKDYLVDFKEEMETQRFSKIWGKESDYISNEELSKIINRT